jgi:Ca2+-transporting ATPase
MRKMAEKKAIIKKLPAVETLGSTTVICSDKTGTLTKGEMTVRKIIYNNKVFNIEGSGYDPKGKVDNLEELQRSGLAGIVTLCNDSSLIENNGNYQVQGQPTEGALLVAAHKLGISSEEYRKKYPRIGEIPFSSERKRMTTIHQNEERGLFAAIKGAPEVILDLCSTIKENGEIKPLDKKKRSQILQFNSKMASNALRVLAVAYKDVPPHQKEFSEQLEHDLTFIALVGMIDPPRVEVKDSIKKCKEAGIRVIMITGDNKLTAIAIAKELGITKTDEALDGFTITEMDDVELSDRLDTVNVFARTLPEHKMRIVKILKEKGEIVAVTGDGVNDAPALKKSDIGIAMGITGTEVTKEASDMVLMDDNFATIVSAIELGRGTFDNIKKYLSYLLSSNVGEILVMFIAGIIGLPLPLIALQILWVNLVTDGLPAIALGIEPPEPDVMDRQPRSPKASVFEENVKSIIFVVGILMAFSCLTVFTWYLQQPGASLIKAQSMAFTTMVVFEMFLAFNCRSIRYSLRRINPFQNRYLVLAVSSSIILTLIVIYTPFFNTIFNTTPLNLNDWIIVLIASFTSILGVESVKTVYRFREKNSSKSDSS